MECLKKYTQKQLQNKIEGHHRPFCNNYIITYLLGTYLLAYTDGNLYHINKQLKRLLPSKLILRQAPEKGQYLAN